MFTRLQRTRFQARFQLAAQHEGVLISAPLPCKVRQVSDVCCERCDGTCVCVLIRTDTANYATLTEKELSQHCAVVSCEHRNSPSPLSPYPCVPPTTFPEFTHNQLISRDAPGGHEGPNLPHCRSSYVFLRIFLLVSFSCVFFVYSLIVFGFSRLLRFCVFVGAKFVPISKALSFVKGSLMEPSQRYPFGPTCFVFRSFLVVLGLSVACSVACRVSKV